MRLKQIVKGVLVTATLLIGLVVTIAFLKIGMFVSFQPDTFVMCKAGSFYEPEVAIDFKNKLRIGSDYSLRIISCAKGQSKCLATPLLISVPPKLPKDASETVKWSVGEYKFELTSLRENTFEIKTFQMEYTLVYQYKDKEGVMQLELTSDDGKYSEKLDRCWGKLRFQDIESLLEDYDFVGYSLEPE